MKLKYQKNLFKSYYYIKKFINKKSGHNKLQHFNIFDLKIKNITLKKELLNKLYES